MPTADYTYGNGGVTQTVNTGGLPGLPGGAGGMDDMASFYKAMAMRKMQQQDQDRQRAQQIQDAALRRAEEDRQNAARTVNPLDDLRMKTLAEGDAIAKSQAMRAPAPTRRIEGPQIIGGDVLDPLAMNAYQRQAYLPGGSTQSGDINVAHKTDQIGEGTTNIHGYDGGSGPEGGKNVASPQGGSAGSDRADWYGLGSYGKYAAIDDEKKKQQGGY